MRALLPFLAACAADVQSSVTVSGTAAPGVEVVFRHGAREEIANAGPDGKYKLVMPTGTYRVFVRDDAVMSVGRMDRVRLPALPIAAAAGALDEALVPALAITADTTDVDLAVVRGGIVTGTVFDFDARPVMGAVVSAHSEAGHRPALGTDVAVSRYDGSFELKLPDGEYQIAATHAQYADATDVGRVDVKGGTRHLSLTLVRGCIITGKVVDAAGASVGEGAIERRLGASNLEFVPNGRSQPDGTFRWTTTDEREVVLRAWPWHHPPSAERRFSCKDGASFKTTFVVPARAPDIAGTLVDKRGMPMPFTHLDIQPLDPGGIAQQERTDAMGRWAVFEMPPGRYMVSAATRHGVLAKTVSVGGFAERLELAGTGRIEGTTTHLVTGSFELALAACLDGATLQLPRDRRLVPVRSGRFVVDDVPACDLQFTVTWKGDTMTARAMVPNAGAARVQLDLGTPRAKRVRGVVRDRDGNTVGNARVTAVFKKESSSAVTNEDGEYSIDTFAGATITVDGTVDGTNARGQLDVGLANVPLERADIVLTSRP